MADELDALLAKRFISRRDVKAVQHKDGTYSPDVEFENGKRTDKYKPWKMKDLRDHLSGQRSLGHYLVDKENNTKLWAMDIDLKKEGHWISFKEDEILNGSHPCNPREIWKDPEHEGREFLTINLRCLAEGLAMRAYRQSNGDYPIAIAYSGNKGLHVYGFMGSVSAEDARQTAIEVLASFNVFEPSKGENFWVHTSAYKNLEIEIFPKQDSLDGKEFGNLMRLPLGINQKSSQKGFFVDTRCGYNQLKALDPMMALNGEYPWGD